MSDTKVLLRAPRKIDHGKIYYLKPITSYHTDDQEKSGLSLYFEKPKVIVSTSNSWGDVDLYFNYHHPNRSKLTDFKYGRDYYGHVCVGDLDVLMSVVENSKYPLILYNFLSTYNDEGTRGYWRVRAMQNRFPCVVCGAKFAIREGAQGIDCCELYDKHGDHLSFDDVRGKNPKFTWDEELNGFIYKGKTYND